MLYLIIFIVTYIFSLIWVLWSESFKKKELTIVDQDLISTMIDFKRNIKNGIVKISKSEYPIINSIININVRFNKIEKKINSMTLEWSGNFGEDDMMYFLDEIKLYI